MIGNIIKGRSFQGVVNYAANKDKARFLGGNIAGKTPKTIITEFEIVQQNLRRNLGRAVFHVSLSLTEDEHLSDEQWNRLAKDYLDGMNFSQSQYVVYLHLDTPHEHIHIIANRVRLNGSTVSDSFDYTRSEDLIHNLEKEYRLVLTVSSKDIIRKSKPNGELRKLLATGEESVREKLQDLIDQTTSNALTMPEFINRLKEVGVDARVSLTRGGIVRGISYEFSGLAFSGTQLGKGYTFPGLQKYKGIEYDSSMFKVPMEASDNTVMETTKHALSEKVFLKARKLFNQLHLMDILKKNAESQYEYLGKRRKMVYSPEEARFSIYDSQSREELLRVFVGEKIVYDKENLTETDLLIFDEALRGLSEITEQSLKDTQKNLQEIG